MAELKRHGVVLRPVIPDAGEVAFERRSRVLETTQLKAVEDHADGPDGIAAKALVGHLDQPVAADQPPVAVPPHGAALDDEQRHCVQVDRRGVL
jgi:hypothetical protein